MLKEDLSWSGFLFFLAVVFGLMYHWPLVKIAWQGDLAAHLDKLHQERRAREFKHIPTVNLEKAHELWRQGETLFLDVRSPEEYAELHVARALNLPEDKLEDEKELKNSGILGLPRDRQIVVYCSTVRCDASLKAARRLQALGFTRVMAFLGGFQAWDEAGYDVDSSR
ncbi:MAG: rhodanese-like domain-containing protein [Desulfobaccales bacterium]